MTGCFDGSGLSGHACKLRQALAAAARVIGGRTPVRPACGYHPLTSSPPPQYSRFAI